MGDIKKIIKQKSFQSIEQEAIVSLLFAGQRIRVKLEEICQSEGITLSQFNILRILKGIYPNAHPRSEIRKRMIDKSDVTRLIDKLVESGLVIRVGSENDKRQSLTAITPNGLKVLDNLDSKFTRTHGQILSKLDSGEMVALVEMLKKIAK